MKATRPYIDHESLEAEAHILRITVTQLRGQRDSAIRRYRRVEDERNNAQLRCRQLEQERAVLADRHAEALRRVVELERGPRAHLAPHVAGHAARILDRGISAIYWPLLDLDEKAAGEITDELQSLVLELIQSAGAQMAQVADWWLIRERELMSAKETYIEGIESQLAKERAYSEQMSRIFREATAAIQLATQRGTP